MSGRPAGPRRGKTRSPGGSIKNEPGKGDVEAISLHTRVQEMFAAHLASLLNDPAALELQCCVTYGKPCGCIRKYILVGSAWKESVNRNLHVTQIKDKDDNQIAAIDQSSTSELQIRRAQELVVILHQASELKKEKCYTVNTESADGKPLKELRGLIGLGNGRKRSKKYEDYVLEKRGTLRNNHNLCEKAAQKLLGYSINFLYKKLRTNPQKTSRLVATNKAERASKVPRHLISLQQLKDMASNQQGAHQCCCRNCISWLVKQRFDKIVDWRQRLEGSGQRVAQEIVAEVLLASASLDGQNSFCQNLVHWVTGCSFKKIRRVRDHLKKDPKSLPEHGLKKYWKDKVKNQAKKRGDHSTSNVLAKVEKDAESYSSLSGIERFPAGYDTTIESTNQISNLNNSNNRFDTRSQYGRSITPNAPANQITPETGMLGTFSSTYNEDGTGAFPTMHQRGQSARHQMFGVTQQNQLQTNFAPAESYRVMSQPPASGYPENQRFQEYHKGSEHPAQHEIPESSLRYHDSQGLQNNSYTQRGKDEQSKYYPTPFITGFQDPNAGSEGQPSYYFAAGGANPGQEGFFQSGMTPFIIAPAQQGDPQQTVHEGSSMQPQFSGQSFFLLSPALPNNSDKAGGFTATDLENWRQMGMPVTPIQMYPAPYLTQNGVNGEGGENKAIQWGTEPQHFMFPVTEPFAGEAAYSDTNQTAEKRQPQYTNQQYFPSALTPVAVMQSPGNNLFSNMGWFAAPTPAQPALEPATQKPPAPTQVPYTQPEDRAKYYQSEQQPKYALKPDGTYYEVAKPQSQFGTQWTSAQPQEYQVKAPEKWTAQNTQPPDAPVYTALSNETAAGAESSSFKDSQPEVAPVRSQMPPLAPLGVGSKPRLEAVEPKRLEMPLLAAIPVDNADPDDVESSPKGAAIGDRTKRFSRDRLRATIDSPCPIPPMTPLTPAMTPVIVGTAPGSLESAETSKDENSASSGGKPAGNSVFLFPPTHVSRRVAALRLQGPTTDLQKAEKSKSSEESTSQDEAAREQSAADTTSKESSTSSSTQNPSTSSKGTSGSLNSATSLGYISESILQGDNAMLVDLSNVKNLPLLSLPSAGWTIDSNMSNVTVNENSPSNQDQQLKIPTQVLHTPTQHSGTPIQQLHTPTQPLNTPTQALHTPTQPLNTPTQPLNTPNNDIESPTTHPPTNQDDESPVKVLMQPPVGKKRKQDSNPEGEKTQKLIRFHHFTSSDFKDGEVNVSQFRKPSEFVSAPVVESDIAKRRRKPRKQNNPQTMASNEAQEHDEKSDSKDEEASESADREPEKPSLDPPTTIQYALQTPSVLQRITPLFNVPTSSSDDQRTSSQPLNTPVFIHSAFMTPSSRLSSTILHRASPAQSMSSTPQFFTFMPTSGFQTPTMFFTPPESADAKSKPIKPKTDTPDTVEKSNRSSPLKRSHMTLTFAQPTSKDDTLQTPSKISVVTPSGKDDDLQTPKIQVVTPSGSFTHGPTTSGAAPIFSFQDSAKLKTSTEPTSKPHTTEKAPKHKKTGTPSKDGSIPKLVVDPPSDTEGDKIEHKSPRASPAKEQPTDANNNKPPVKQTLHRVRSGGKGDLVLSLKPGSGEDALKSPLNTPSGIQVITPTLAGGIPPAAGKLGSPGQRLPPAIRLLPQSMMMAPICVNPTSNPTQSSTSGMQVHTPTVFHLISPSQVTPPSPSVLVYPFGPRGFAGLPSVRSTGPLSCGSLGGSPAFNLLQRGSTPVGGGSGSLLKSALMKKWPVFQFPPPGPLPSESDSEKNNEPSDVASVTETSSDFAESLPDSESAGKPTDEELRGKLSGANDPCLSEAAEKLEKVQN